MEAKTTEVKPDESETKTTEDKHEITEDKPDDEAVTVDEVKVVKVDDNSGEEPAQKKEEITIEDRTEQLGVKKKEEEPVKVDTEASKEKDASTVEQKDTVDDVTENKSPGDTAATSVEPMDGTVMTADKI